MENIDFLKCLNESQRIAVCSNFKYLLVLAGAGSGKTRILIYKIIWLILEKNVNPNSILAITFTNRAANEINNRIFNLLKNKYSILTGTFHSLSNRILRINYKSANLSSNFHIIDNYDQLKIIKNIIQSLKLNERVYNSSIILKYINKNKEHGIRENNIICNSYLDNIYLKIYKNYQKICNNSNLIDFPELLIRSYELLKNNNNILEKYRNKFNNILVDEFQDTNTIQYLWIKILIDHKLINVTIVGDDDQSIYGWRGANIENINNFIKDFSNSKILYLEQNYRSTKNIIEAANNLISNNINRSKKKLWTNKENGDLINVYKANNEIEEAKFVISYIYNNYKYLNKKTCAILYRNNYQSRILEEYLLFYNLKYQIYGGLKFLDRQEIKQALSYMRLIVNNDDNLAYEKIINFPPRRIGKNTIELIKNYSLNVNISYWKSSIYLINNKNILKTVSKNSLNKFINLINLIKNEILNDNLPTQVKKIIQFSGLLNFYKLKKENNYSLSSKLENLDELVNASKQFFDRNEKNNISSTLQEFLLHISLKLDFSNSDNNNDNLIQLMTIHSSKGLEFNKLFIVGMEEGIFPSQESTINNNLLEEERRLAYVGFTRAIETITITYSESRYFHGKLKNNKHSRFIDEIPNIFLKYINK